ncbi:glycosyltransferase 87 family protein [Streptomyces sp. NPDC002790]|uniref:glycosyltransferase 87 family protein n=1 Tax=Streptomyces sp. NPDC002790 TaxID=3154431 RepID=UPI00331E06EE
MTRSLQRYVRHILPAPYARYEPYAWAACAVAALGLALASDLRPHQVWGAAAAGGYALAAVLACDARSRPAARPVAVVGAVMVPLVWQVAAGLGQLELTVVERSGHLLFTTGSPYVTDPVAVADFNPYLPGMALFGVLPGDARWWLGGTFVVCLVAGGLYRGWLFACPLVALPLAVGGVDLPVVGLMCLGLVLAERGRPGRAGLVLGVAAALKWTAWPAFPVVLALIAACQGGRPALRYAAVALSTTTAAVLPFALIDPAGFYRNVGAFPLGLTDTTSPAASPLPGQLLATYVPGGTVITLTLLTVSALLLAVSVMVRPPKSARAAAVRLALGLGLAIALMPATRFGYLVHPLVLGATAYGAPRRRATLTPTTDTREKALA